VDYFGAFSRITWIDEVLKQNAAPDRAPHPHMPQVRGRAALPGQFLVDDALESIERLGAGKESAVDEEGRCALHAYLLTFLVVALNVGPEFSGVVAGVERLGVQTDVGGVLLQIVVGQRSLVGEQLVVILPELALFVSALRRFGRRLRTIV
jgi:hypothetical protein